MMKQIIHNFYKVTPDYWMMLLNLFFMKVGQFMLLPFLAIYLSKNTSIHYATIGLIIGVGPFIYGITGFISGILIDRFGVKKTMIFSLVVGGLTTFFFFYATSVAWLLLMSAMVGITRSIFDIASKSYNLTGVSLDDRKIYFSLRFMTVNCAAAIGPVIGAYFAENNSILSFKIIGIFYCVLSVMAAFMFNDVKTSTQISRELVLGKVFKLARVARIKFSF